MKWPRKIMNNRDRLRFEPVTSTIYARTVNAYVNFPGDGSCDCSFMSLALKCAILRLTLATGIYLYAVTVPRPFLGLDQLHSKRLPEAIYPEEEWLEREANNSLISSFEVKKAVATILPYTLPR
jgi:hypothetical protein